MSSACDSCCDPGYCCRGLSLTTFFPVDMLREEVYQHTAEGTDPWGGHNTTEETPQFRPIRVAGRYIHPGQHKPHGVTWSFSCDWLGEDGRCMDYKNRPKLCRSYKPKSDLLCIEYDGSLKGKMWSYPKEQTDGEN